MEKKRQRNHFRYNQNVKQKWVEPGCCGLFFTCNGNEKQAVREAYNVIEQALEAWKEKGLLEGVDSDGAVSEKESSDQEDVADLVKRFCDQARSNKRNVEKRKIWQRPTGANNCLFFVLKDVKVEKIYDFVDFLVEMVLSKRCCRFLQRVWPVEKTCRVDMVELDTEVSRLISRHFYPNKDGKWPTYMFEFKARNNDSLGKSDVMDMVLLALKQLAPDSHVSLDNPTIAILVQIVHKSVMLSCIEHFITRRKLSLHYKE
uniref:THUMP domain-containing protein n=1 Tax=Setaria digitata TaxID=48799 RepID=A0A915PXW5_9BILA